MSEKYSFEDYDNQKKSKKKRRGGIAIGFIIVIIVCLVLGALFSLYIVSPRLEDEPETVVHEEETKALPETVEEDVLPDLEIGGDALPIQEYRNPVVEIAKNLGPAVVGVRASVPQFNIGQPAKDIPSSFGSGFFINSDGYVVTNQHVVEGAERFTIVMLDGQEISAELIGGDSFSDIAVLKVDPSELENMTVAPIGDSDEVLVGELAVAIGSPLGESLGGSVTVGYISAVNREVEGSRYLQTDAAINPGNSGGPLVNSTGEVIGINALKSYLAGIDEQGIPISTEGIGFAIPINDAVKVAKQLIKEGSVERPGIGIQFYPMTEEDAELWEVPRGALVQAVTSGGPAAMAGMKENDIIIGVEGATFEDPEELSAIVRKFSVGDTVVFTVWRESSGSEIDLSIVIGDLNKIH